MRIQGLSSRAIMGMFYARLEQEVGRFWWPRVAMQTRSDQEAETYKWLGMAPPLREWKNGRLVQGLRENGFTISNKTWESTLGLNVDDMRRDKTGQIAVRIGDQVQRALAHPLKLIMALIAAGHNTLCYDGDYFFDTDHSEGSSGNQKNLLTNSEVSQLDVTTAAAPTPYEMANAIFGVINYMTTILDDQGEPMNELASEFIVVCPPGLTPAAQQAVTKDIVGAASGHAMPNPLLGGNLKVAVFGTPRLATWTTDFVVLRADAAAKPFIFQEELPLQVSAQAEGSPVEFDDNEHRYGLKWICNAGYGLWQYAAKATLS